MIDVARSLEGQLTATLMATKNDIRNNPLLVEEVKDICGRFILNAVPTGVEVCQSMQHGGPFPATTDSRFGAVGADAIKRFARPIAFQNWSNDLLPDELKNENPLGIWRTVNNELKKVRLRTKRVKATHLQLSGNCSEADWEWPFFSTRGIGLELVSTWNLQNIYWGHILSFHASLQAGL